jgi:CheY-like chemotaxis protein
MTMHGENQSSEERNVLLYQAKKAALVAVDLTRQISCFSNFGIVSRENLRVDQLVRDTVDQFFKGHNDQYRLTVASGETRIHADTEELSQAIVKVLQNAVEASSGKPLEVIVEDNEFTTAQLMSGQYVSAGKYARIDIRDRGSGIHSDQLFRIFDPYYSTKERGAMKGMGLGLTVVYAVLRNHGGYVVVRSKANSGTTVSLYLPALQDDLARSSLEPGPPAEKRVVLLIEPDEKMGEIYKIMLEYLGFSVKVSSNRAGAIQQLEQLIGDSYPPRPLVILALSDKNGESPIKTCRLLHQIDPAIKVIAMSGAILDPVMANYRDYGFVNTISEPFSLDGLKHIINTVLHT